MSTTPKPRFGDRVRNVMASEGNPRRESYFVRVVNRHRGMDSGRWYQCTDGKGHFWNQSPAFTEVVEAWNRRGTDE